MSHMNDQFERLGILFTRVEAVDAKSMTDEQIARFRASFADAERHSTWSPGGTGCLLSHKKARAEIAFVGDRYSTVFEDDAHLSDQIATLLKNPDWIPESADIVRLETTLQSMKLEPNPVSQIDRTKVFKVHSGAWGAAGYVIRHDIAEWLAHSPQRMSGQADWFLFHKDSPAAQALTVFQCDPAPCVQDQYHPGVSCRRNFDKVTLDSTSWAHAMKMVGRQVPSPLVRQVTGRCGVPFA
jgi:glycosyl transferase family 25